MNNRNVFLNNIAQTSSSPLMLEIEKAEGVFLYSPNGENYIDFISGISVSNIGHCHPNVVNAIKEQSQKFMHLMVYGEYIYSPQTMLASKLSEILPKKLNNYYFTNSGTEAVEGALKLAKRYNGKHKIHSFKNSYHGSTAGALSIMGSEEYKKNYRPLVPGNQILEFNNLDSIDLIDEDSCAVIFELVQAEAGVISANMDFINKLLDKCKEHNVLLILDEIQTGFGRTGSLFCFEKFNFVPDILLIGKGFGGGMPIGAFIANKEIMKEISHSPILGHISTFAGNPVCCSAALANVNTILEEINFDEVEKKGNYIEMEFKKLGFSDINRLGMILSINMNSFEENLKIIEKCILNGLIVDWFLFNNTRMRVCPPLNITYSEIDEAIVRFKNSLS